MSTHNSRPSSSSSHKQMIDQINDQINGSRSSSPSANQSNNRTSNESPSLSARSNSASARRTTFTAAANQTINQPNKQPDSQTVNQTVKPQSSNSSAKPNNRQYITQLNNQTIDYGQLLRLCVECYDSFPLERITAEIHVQDFCTRIHPELADQSINQSIHHDQTNSQSTLLNTADFVREVFFSMLRLSPILTITVDGLMSHSVNLSRSERTLYVIVCLLIIEFLSINQSISWKTFECLIRSQQAHSMHACLSFLFTTDQRLIDWLIDQWSTIYDQSYVNDRIYQSINQHKPKAKVLIESLERSIKHAEAKRNATLNQTISQTINQSKQSTVIQPFNLSATKPKQLPMPIPITSHYVAKPVPKMLNATSLARLDEERKARHQSIKQSVIDRHANDVAPSLHAAARPTTLARAIDEKQNQIIQSTTQISYSRPMPSYPSPTPVSQKTTAAMILREEEFYRRQREQESEELLKFEQELRDSSEFDKWQADMRQKDQESINQTINQRKQDMAQSALRAQAAVTEMIKVKQTQATRAKEEADIKLAQLESEAQKEQNEKERAAKLLSSSLNQSVNQSINQLARSRRSQAAAVAAEKRELARVKAEREAAELVEKKALLKRIQAMEKLAAARAKQAKVVELSAVGSNNQSINQSVFLDAMSIAEMRERLRLLEQREADMLADKRAAIAQSKQWKATVLEDMHEKHQRLRKQRNAALNESINQSKAEKAAMEDRIKANCLAEELAYKAKKSVQIEAALKLAQQSVSLSNQRQKELEQRGVERAEADRRQAEDLARGQARLNNALEEQQRDAAAEVQRLKSQKEANMKKAREHLSNEQSMKEEQRRIDLEQRYEEAKEMNSMLQQVQITQTQSIKQSIEQSVDKLHNRNKYATTISESHLTAAREEAAARAAIENAAREREIRTIKNKESLMFPNQTIRQSVKPREESKEPLEQTSDYLVATTVRLEPVVMET